MQTILVIEDEDGIREGLVDILETSDFLVIAAENGLNGIELARQHKPNLILCDLMMPKLGGYEVLTQLRQDPSLAAIPLIFLTANADKESIRQGMNLGADDYLTKPIGRLDLLQAITSRLKKQNSIDNHFQHKLDALRASISLCLPHELRTPLTGIIGLSEILVEEYASIQPDDLLEIAQDLHNSANRLYRLIQNFLMYTELELVSNDEPRKAKFIGTQFTGVAGIIEKIATNKAQQVDRETDLELDLQDAVVRMSGTNFQKIVEEIFDNALKYSPAGTKISIVTRCDRQTLTLCVIDRGRGMNKESISEIGAYMQFERRLYEQQGSGLGLIIAQRIVHLHGGQFSIDSEPHQFTKVCITIPTIEKLGTSSESLG